MQTGIPTETETSHKDSKYRYFRHRLSFYAAVPVRDWRFASTLASLAIPLAIQQITEHSISPSASSAFPEFTITALYGIPVFYAAMNFGLFATAFTAGLATVGAESDMARHLVVNDIVGVWADNVQIVIIDVVGIIVGHFVEVSKAARQTAEDAVSAYRKAETRYRELFLNTLAPIVVIDNTGTIVEANPSFSQQFGQGGLCINGAKLASFIGAEETTALLAFARAGTANGDADQTEPVPVAGAVGAYRAQGSHVTGPEGVDFIQVVFHDVTQEERRRLTASALASSVLRGQEEERRRIARELHDEPVQLLVQLCRLLDRSLADASKGEGSQQALAEARALATQVAGDLRSIARGLRPALLDELGLLPAIRSLASELSSRSGMETSIEVTGDEIHLADNVELALYRITQEALSNVERHSGASRVWVVATFTDWEVTVEVTDNGRGFKGGGVPSPIVSPTSLGIAGMSERVQQLGGILRVGNAEGQGTHLVVIVPIGSK